VSLRPALVREKGHEAGLHAERERVWKESAGGEGLTVAMTLNWWDVCAGVEGRAMLMWYTVPGEPSAVCKRPRNRGRKKLTAGRYSGVRAGSRPFGVLAAGFGVLISCPESATALVPALMEAGRPDAAGCPRRFLILSTRPPTLGRCLHRPSCRLKAGAVMLMTHGKWKFSDNLRWWKPAVMSRWHFLVRT